MYHPITFHEEEPLEGRQVDCAFMNDDIDAFVKMVDKFKLRKESTSPLLHEAVCGWRWAPNITKYLVERGENVDVVCDFKSFDLKQATPIDLTLAQIAYDFNQHYHLYKPSHRKPIYDMLVFLCHQTRVPLEILRMLVKHNQNTERVRAAIVNYARRAQLVHLASMFLVAPEIFFSEDCLFDQLYKHFNILKLRTSMHEELSKLLDILAVVGHKLVAYIRLDYSHVQTPRLTYMDVAFLLHEVACKQGISSPNNYFFRFFEADLPSSHYEPDYAVKRTALSATIFPWALLFVPNDLREKHIQPDYINRLFPSPKPEDTDSLNSAIETKLSSMSTLRGCPEDVTRIPKTGESYLPGGAPFPPVRIPEPRPQSYLPQGVPFPPVRIPQLTPRSYLLQGFPFPPGRNHEPRLQLQLFHRYMTCASDRFDVKFTSTNIWEKKVIKRTRLETISAKLPVFVKRLIK